MTSAQEQTVARYHELMQINAVSHFLRTARQIGLMDQLRQRQHTLDEICEALGLRASSTRLLLDALVTIGIVERYGEDFAMSQAGQLLCRYDKDFGDEMWGGLLASLLAGKETGEKERLGDENEFFDHQAATQWRHTPAAIQAAEVLDMGGDQFAGARILDLGCGSAVWSLAMAHRDPSATLTVVDHSRALESASSTAGSIDLTDRMDMITGDFREVDLPPDSYDLVLVAQRISGLDDDAASQLVRRAVAAVRQGGRVALIDVFKVPSESDAPAVTSMAECIEALRLEVGTSGGRIRSLKEAQALLSQAGLQQVQFAYLSASRLNLGVAVGVKPTAAN